MVKLGVNIDHVATVRQARGGREPNLLEAARLVKKGGADGLTIHLREDRRHIQEEDVRLLRKKLRLPLNLEMALDAQILQIALDVKPPKVCFVPERREEKTTEGGLDVTRDRDNLREAIGLLKKNETVVSLFIEPDFKQVQASKEVGADFIEFHTGAFANAFAENLPTWNEEVIRLHNAAQEAQRIGLRVNAGHGLNYQNVEHVLKIPSLEELNIGHSIVARAIFVGLKRAVKEMKDLIVKFS